MSKHNITPVVFRVYPEGDVIALFPYVYEGNYNISCYQHVGQHGAVSYEAVISSTKPAAPEQYADLKAELESLTGNGEKLYPELRVIKHAWKRLMYK